MAFDGTSVFPQQESGTGYRQISCSVGVVRDREYACWCGILSNEDKIRVILLRGKGGVEPVVKNT
jgi:hypothetical protein